MIHAEAPIHAQIKAYCRKAGWLCMSSRSDRSTSRTRGEPDFTILAPNRVLFIECKSPKGKLSEDQEQFATRAARLGHWVRVVRSWDDFLKAL